MADIADDDPTPASILQDRARSGRLSVAVAGDDRLAGFLIWSPKDGQAYIEEVTVDAAHAGHRLAARMIDRLADDVRANHPAITLTTFRDVPWMAPYYAKLGFAEFPYDQAGPEHLLSWQHQAEDGLEMSRRLFMSRPIACRFLTLFRSLPK